jgi:predicted DNA-binding protein
MTTITCKLPDKVAARLEALGRSEGRSKSALVLEAIEERLRHKRRQSRPSAYDLVKHLCGSIKDGPSDLATNPKYMEGFGE